MDLTCRFSHKDKLNDWIWFQLLTEPVTHNLGTLMTFGLGIVYCWLQSYITLRVNIKNEGWKVGLVRLLLSGAITLAMILCILYSDQFNQLMSRFKRFKKFFTIQEGCYLVSIELLYI